VTDRAPDGPQRRARPPAARNITRGDGRD